HSQECQGKKEPDDPAYAEIALFVSFLYFSTAGLWNKVIHVSLPAFRQSEDRSRAVASVSPPANRTRTARGRRWRWGTRCTSPHPQDGPTQSRPRCPYRSWVRSARTNPPCA